MRRVSAGGVTSDIDIHVMEEALKPLRIGIIGLGGFAGAHHDAIARLEKAGEAKLICTCDPDLKMFDARREALQFAERGVRIFSEYKEMLDACRAELDVVIIPTPIPLHAPMHQACVERGLAVYLEKPPTLDSFELARMIQVDAAARFQTVVGFNFIVEPERQALKRRLVAGEFGRVLRVSAFALWGRNAAYFARAGWAGRLMLDGRLVLDSCIGNAAAHQVHNALFWCGTQDFWSWGDLALVEAELYRVHRIEGMDTAFVRAKTGSGVDLRIGMTHACHERQTQEECVACERAVIRYHINHSGPEGSLYSIAWNDGCVEHGGQSGGKDTDLVQVNLRAYMGYLRGQVSRPATRLVDSRPFVQINNLAYIAAGKITTIPDGQARQVEGGFLSVAGLPEAIVKFIDTGMLPSAQGLPWAMAGGAATPADLGKLEETIRRMVVFGTAPALL